MAAAFGTAPRRIRPGIWTTRTGRRLTPEGSAYWENLFASGRTDGRGRMTAAHPSVTQASPRAKKPLPANWLTGPQTPKQKRQQAIYQKSQQDTKEAKAHVDQATRARFGGVEETAARANKSINPAAGAMLNALSPLTATEDTLSALKHHDLLKAGLSAAAIAPFGPGKGTSLVRGAKTAAEVLPAASKESSYLLDVIPDAKKAYEAQESARKVERAQRAGKMQEAFEKAGGGAAGHAAAKAQLRGQYTKVRFDDLSGLDEAAVNKLHNEIRALPHLTDFEKNSLGEMLGRVRDEHLVPRPFEVALVEKAFGPKAAEQLAATIPLETKIARVTAEVANIPRSILASGDVSAPFRQALVAFAHDPVMASKHLGPMFKHLFSQAYHDQSMARIAADPEFGLMQQAQIAFTGMKDITHREEAFASGLAEKIPLLGRFVKSSGRAYTGFLNDVRANMFKGLLAEAREQGVQLTRKEIADLGKITNWATGRGHLGKHEGAALLLNSFLFSPRLLASRLNSFNPMFYKNLSPFARKKAATAMVRLVAAGSGVLGLAALAGAKVTMDPRSSDWGKIKFGNTRIDPWGGHQQIARTMAQIASGGIVSTTKPGQVTHLKGGARVFDPLTRLGESKLAPVPSVLNDWRKGENFVGQPFNWGQEAKQHSIPLLYQDIFDAYHDTDSIPASAGLFGLGAFGVGIQSYRPTKKKSSKGDPFASLFGDDGGTAPSGRDPFANLFP